MALELQTSTRTYTLTVEKKPDGYLAYFPALAGCHTWASTYEEAVAHAEEALTLYLETLADNGDPIPEERSDKPVSLGVTVRTPVIAWYARAAARLGRERDYRCTRKCRVSD